jgi:O-antigen ligase
LAFVAFGIFLTVFVNSLPAEIIFSSTAARVVALATLLVLFSFGALIQSSARSADSTQVFFSLSLVAWWFLLITDKIFAREGSIGDLAQGRLPLAAYGEVLVWVLVFVLFCVSCLKRPRYPLRMFTGANKWMSVFALLCILSVTYSPHRMFSLAWAFKLCLVVLLLETCSTAMWEVDRIRRFFQVTCWGFVLGMACVISQVLADPSRSFETGRLGGVYHPTEVSDVGVVVLVLSLMLYFLDGRKWHIPLAVLGSMTMILGGGKAALASGIISATLFLLLQGKRAWALGLLAGMLTLTWLVIAASPLSSYFRNYFESGQLSTFTGRTDLWIAAFPAIYESPIWGHGYMASKFVSLAVPGVKWAPGHMHNAFLEVLYNNGFVGLIALLSMIVLFWRNLIPVIRQKGPRDLHVLAVGSFALSTGLLVEGFFNRNIGGRPDSLFMLFLALVALSGRLRALTREDKPGSSSEGPM